MSIATNKIITAAALAIGDELLSGRTRDKNIGHLATALTQQGIDLKEVRIVADDENDIVFALNELRQRYTYVFTSGGIGPTHDDITADAIARAFEVTIDYNREAIQILETHYRKNDMELTTARKRMARIPAGASLIENPVSRAPGFSMGNVYVLAGVPSVFQAMLETILPKLEGGSTMISKTIPCSLGEGTIGDPLGEIQRQNPDTSIGSYPKFDGTNFSTQIVIRSRSQDALDQASDAVSIMLEALLSNPSN